MLSGKTYYTHFNGSRPYQVDFSTGEGEAHIVNIHKDDGEGFENGKRVKQFVASKVYIGKSTGDDTFFHADHKTCDSEEYDGNSILLETGENTYVLIGDEITEFSTEEQITNFWSSVGRNDVPYPVAESENHLYFLASSDMKSIPKDVYKTSFDDYMEGCGEEGEEGEGQVDGNYEFAYHIYYENNLDGDELDILEVHQLV